MNNSKFVWYNIIFLGILYSVFITILINLTTEDIGNYLIVNLLRLFLIVGIGLLEFISLINELIKQNDEKVYVPKMILAFIYSLVKDKIK